MHLMLGQQALARPLRNQLPIATGEQKLTIGQVLRAAVAVVVHPNQHLTTGVAAARLLIQTSPPTIGVQVLAIRGPTLLLGEEAVAAAAVVEPVLNVGRKDTCRENVLPPVMEVAVVEVAQSPATNAEKKVICLENARIHPVLVEEVEGVDLEEAEVVAEVEAVHVSSVIKKDICLVIALILRVEEAETNPTTIGALRPVQEQAV